MNDQPMRSSSQFDYQLYRFGRSQQLFRGPAPDRAGGYVACLGGAATFGRFTRRPFPTLLAEGLDVPVVNLGAEGAGPGFFLRDSEVLEVAARARACVVQVMGAPEMSNRLYTVRPRRNQRLFAVSDLLCQIYPEVRFDQFVRVDRMLDHLAMLDGKRFTMIATEIRNAWIGRMTTLLSSIETDVMLFWFSQRRPEDAALTDRPSRSIAPSMVDRDMVDAVADAAHGYVECISSAGLPQDLTEGGRPVYFRPKGDPIVENRTLPSPEMHVQAAELLLPVVTASATAR